LSKYVFVQNFINSSSSWVIASAEKIT